MSAGHRHSGRNAELQRRACRARLWPPADALGFDFDGATFSHIGSRVTFEVLLASFALDHPGLKRLGLLVHYLDVGGIQSPEAMSVETVLAGLRDTVSNDDQLLTSASAVFDSLLAAFEKGVISE